MQVYLAGPIAGLSYTQVTDWRDSFTAHLHSQNARVRVADPMRGKAYLKDFTTLPATGLEKQGILSSGKAILDRDHSDVKGSQLIVVNLLGAKTVSIGTVMEIAWAHTLQIPTVVIIEDPVIEEHVTDGKPLTIEFVNPHEHSMLLASASYRVKSIEDALQVTLAFFR